MDPTAEKQLAEEVQSLVETGGKPLRDAIEKLIQDRPETAELFEGWEKLERADLMQTLFDVLHPTGNSWPPPKPP